jgi:two-component system, chemotaxis family, chemotaxis protein CheY
MPKTVIAVDDSMSIRETVKTTLEPAGYEVYTADDGASGLQLCEQHPAQLVVTDLAMPHMDGITLIARLRALPQYQTVPIFLLATEVQEDRKVAAKKAGATGWIAKPFDPARLLELIKKSCPP